MINNYDLILEWVNKIRAIYNAPPTTELAKGVACNGNHCPLANSLLEESKGVYQVDISYDHFVLYLSYPLEYEGDLGKTIGDELEDGKFFHRFIGKIPDFIRDFLVEIDDNQYPDLAEPQYNDNSTWDDSEEYNREQEQDTIKYEQTFVSKREWFKEEDEEWDEFDEEGFWEFGDHSDDDFLDESFFWNY